MIGSEQIMVKARSMILVEKQKNLEDGRFNGQY